MLSLLLSLAGDILGATGGENTHIFFLKTLASFDLFPPKFAAGKDQCENGKHLRLIKHAVCVL